MTDSESTGDDAPQARAQKWILRQPMWVRHTLVWTALSPGMLATLPFLTKILGLRFIASANHADGVWPTFSIIGFVLGVLLAFYLAKQGPKGMSELKWMMGLVFAPVIMALILNLAVRDGLALVLATAIRKETTLNFTIAHHKPGYRKGCSQAIDFKEFLLARLCNVPDEVRDSFVTDNKSPFTAMAPLGVFSSGVLNHCNDVRCRVGENGSQHGQCPIRVQSELT